MARGEIYSTDSEYAQDIDDALAVRNAYELGLGHITDFGDEA